MGSVTPRLTYLGSESRQNQSSTGIRCSALPALRAQGGLGGAVLGGVRFLSVTPAAVVVTHVPTWLPGPIRRHFPLGTRGGRVARRRPGAHLGRGWWPTQGRGALDITRGVPLQEDHGVNVAESTSHLGGWEGRPGILTARYLERQAICLQACPRGSWSLSWEMRGVRLQTGDMPNPLAPEGSDRALWWPWQPGDCAPRPSDLTGVLGGNVPSLPPSDGPGFAALSPQGPQGRPGCSAR